MKKHILLFLDYYLPHCGGVETVFEQITKGLLIKGHKVTLLTSRFDEHLKDYEKDGDLEIYRVGKNRLSFLFKSLFKGGKLLKNKNFDIIHASTYVGAIPASLLAKIYRKKVVLTVHEVFGKLWFSYKGWFLGWIYLLFERFLFALPYDVYHCVSNYTMNSLRLLYRIDDSKIVVINNGVDYDFWDPKKISEKDCELWKKEHSWNGRHVVLYYGHAGKSKGLDVLINCIPQIIKHDPTVLFVLNIIHSKRKEGVISRLRFLEKFGFARQIQIFGGVSKKDLRTMLACSDVVVAPSFSEGFGSVHTETCAMNKTLITTNIASLPEVVGGKVLFVQVGSAEQLLEAILLQKDENFEIPELEKKMFYRKDTLDQIEKLYQNL